VEKVLWRDWLSYKSGFKRMMYTNYSPPDNLLYEVSPGEWVKPKETIKTEVIIMLGWAARLRVLLSGKIQVINVVWCMDEVNVKGDIFRWEVLPPRTPVNQKDMV
jgi:hypothetical protein